MLPGDAADLASAMVGTLVGATVLLAGLLGPRLVAGTPPAGEPSAGESSVDESVAGGPS